MKKNKLQEFADKSLSKYDNPAIREQFVRESADGDVKVVDNRRRTWLLSVVAVIIIIAALALGTYFLLTTPHKKHYLLENQQAHAVTIDEVNAGLSGFTVGSSLVASCQQVDDTVYKEKLYYKVVYSNDGTGEKIEIIIVANSDYTHLFNHEDYTDNYNALNMTYVEKFTERNGIYEFNSRGEFAVGNLKIYVKYHGPSMGTQSNFISFLEQCVELT